MCIAVGFLAMAESSERSVVVALRARTLTLAVLLCAGN